MKEYLGFRIEKALIDQIKELAEQQDRSVSWIVTQMIKEALAEDRDNDN